MIQYLSDSYSSWQNRGEEQTNQMADIIESTYPAIELPNRPFHHILLDAIKQHAATGKNKIAFESGSNPNDVITYEQLYNVSYKVAAFLQQSGFKKDVACLVMPNMWHYCALYLGIGLNGGAISGASALFTDYELGRQFVDSRCRAVITTEDFLPKVMKAVADSPNVKTVIVITRSSSTVLPQGVVSFDSILSTTHKFDESSIHINIAEDLLFLPYSSGTTGPPKGVMLTHLNHGTMMMIYAKHDATNNCIVLDPEWDYQKESMMLLLPFYHVYGFGLLNTALLYGCKGVILTHFDHNVFCSVIQKNKIRMLPLVPPILVFLAKHPICSQFDLSSLEMIITGAAPAGRDICEEVVKRYPNIKYIQQGYGMTENSMATHIPDLKLTIPFGSVGKLASNLRMKVMDPVTGKDLKRGDRGEICIQGPTVMKGYLGRPEATANTIVDGWLHTGDIGYVDKDGFLFIVDRLKELIKVKGLQVAPAELEDLLLSHSRIRDAAVIGIPDENAGELPKAFIVRADEQLTEDDVKNYVKGKVSVYKELAGGVEFVKEIPKSAAGKILRRLLRDQSISKSKL